METTLHGTPAVNGWLLLVAVIAQNMHKWLSISLLATLRSYIHCLTCDMM